MLDGYDPPPGTVEVLEWLPGELVPDFPGGLWSLEALDQWLNPDLDERHAESREGRMEEDQGTLAEWVAGELGYPVHLVPQDDEIGIPVILAPVPRNKVTRAISRSKVTQAVSRRIPARWISRRLYWVLPA